MREAVARRAGNRCEYCRLSQESQVATFPADHIQPVVLNGPTELDNLALACPRCNARKWVHVEAEDPEAGQSVPLFNPRTQVWAEHFRWSEADATILEPLTATGRATLNLLDLNATPHRRIRRLLMTLGMHPPT
jgi:hypothetical protein